MRASLTQDAVLRVSKKDLGGPGLNPHSVGDLGPVTLSQPNLPHKVVGRRKWRRREWCKLLWISTGDKGEV